MEKLDWDSLSEHQKKWWHSMIKKYKSVSGVRKFMAKSSKRGGGNGGQGGFTKLAQSDPDRLKQISSMGGKISKRGKGK
jgi:hypothetical protein